MPTVAVHPRTSAAFEPAVAEPLPGLPPLFRPAPRLMPQWAAVALLLAAGWILFGWHVGARGLWSAHEGRAAQNAQNMLDQGLWLTPTLFTGDPEIQKPPLYYWAVALLSLPGGQVTPLTVRLPSVLCALAGLLLIHRLGTRFWSWETGVAAAVVLATTTRYAWLGRVGRLDAPLTAVVLAGMYLYWTGVAEPALRPGVPDRRRGPADPAPPARLSLGFYALMGAGVLLKGPVAAVLMLLPVLAYTLVRRHPWAPLRLGAGAAAATAVAGPWFAWRLWQSGGAFFGQFFVYHNVVRALGTDEALKSGPFWFYVPRLATDMLPWSLLLLPMLAALVRQRRRLWQADHPWACRFLFLLCWLGTHFVFLSLVSFKRGDYLAPLLPAVALLLVGWLRERGLRFERRLRHRPIPKLRRRGRTILVGAYLLSALAVPLVVWGVIEFRKKGIVETLFESDLLARHLNVTDRFMLGHVERLLIDHQAVLAIAGVALVGGVWLLHTGWHARRTGRVMAGMALPWVACFLIQVHVVLPAIEPLREMTRFGQTVRTLAGPDETVFYFGKFDADLIFHAGRPAKAVGDWEEMVALAAARPRTLIVVKPKMLEWITRDPRTAGWRQLADNRSTRWGQHRDPRILIGAGPTMLGAGAAYPLLR